jgi:hypothetical protein
MRPAVATMQCGGSTTVVGERACVCVGGGGGREGGGRTKVTAGAGRFVRTQSSAAVSNARHSPAPMHVSSVEQRVGRSLCHARGGEMNSSVSNQKVPVLS